MGIKNTLVALALAGSVCSCGNSETTVNESYHEELRYTGYKHIGNGELNLHFRDSDGNKLVFYHGDSNFNPDEEYTFTKVNPAARYDVTVENSFLNGLTAKNIVVSKTSNALEAE